MIKSSGYAGEIIYEARLYEGEASGYLRVLIGLPSWARTVLLIGHNPPIEELLHLLTGGVRPMPTAALVCVDLAFDHWDKLTEGATGRMRFMLLPRTIDSV